MGNDPDPIALRMQSMIQQIPFGDLRTTRDNPRKFRQDQPFKDLVASVSKLGVLQPILVRPIPDAVGKNGEAILEIRAGERRWRAAKEAGHNTVPGIVRVMTDQEAMEVTVTENMHRADLTPLEEAAGVAGMIRAGFDTAAIADKLGKTPGWVLRRARLMELSPRWRKALEDANSPLSRWSATSLELVARFPAKIQDELIEDWGIKNAESLKQIERVCADRLRTLSQSPWDLTDAKLEPKAGACTSCPKRSSHTPGLFDDAPDAAAAAKNDRCLDAECWERKRVMAVKARIASCRREHPDLILLADGYSGNDEKAFGKIVSSYSVSKSKRGVTGAVPAFVLSGKGAGSVAWVLYRPDMSSGRSSRPVGADGKPKPKSLKEREQELHARRVRWARMRTASKIRGAVLPPAGDRAAVAAAVGWGTEGRITHCYGGNPTRAFANALQFEHPEQAKVLWAHVRRNVAAWIEHDMTDASQAEAALIGLGYKDLLNELLEKAAKEIPEPKSWAAERAGAAKKARGAKS